jgi:2-hydroxychromene-2-carboxylate isomerase
MAGGNRVRNSPAFPARSRRQAVALWDIRSTRAPKSPWRRFSTRRTPARPWKRACSISERTSISRFWIHFGSPNAYLSHRVLSGIEARTGARFDYVPVLFGGLFKLSGNQSPMTAFAAIPNKLAYELLEMKRFVAKQGLAAFRMNPHFPVNTLALMRGAVAAEEEDVFARYIEATFHFIWEEPRILDDPAELAAALTEAGLPAERLIKWSQEQAVKDRLAANTQSAYERGAFGLPTFLVGDELFFGKDRLRDVEEEIVMRQSLSG